MVSCKLHKSNPAENIAQKNAYNDYLYGAQFIDACAQRMKGNFNEALKLFEACQKIDKTGLPLNYELATLYRLLGQTDQSLYYAKICALGNPKNEWYQLIYIDNLVYQKNYAEAIKQREQLVKNFPNKPEFKEDLAIDYSRAGQYEKSLKIYSDLENEIGVNEQLTLNKIKLLKQLKKTNEAEQELIKLSTAYPYEPRYFAYLADFYLEQGNKEKAKQMYDKITLIDPQNPNINLALSDYYNSTGNEKKAFECLKTAFANPDLDISAKAGISINYYKKAETSANEEIHNQGKELAEIFLKTHPKSAEANGIYADFLMLERKQSEAILYYNRSALADKGNYRVWEQLLFLYNDTKQYDSLEVSSQRALDVFPQQPIPYFFNGYSNYIKKNYTKAIASLHDGLEFVIDNKNLMFNFFSTLGEAYNANGDFAKSDKAFDDALKINADDPTVLNNYAYYISVRKNPDLEKAEKLAKKCMQLKPNMPNYMDTYGWILFKMEKYTQALEWIEQASALAPKNPNIIEHYGDVLFKNNKPGEALKQWNLAKQLGNNSESLNKKITNKRID